MASSRLMVTDGTLRINLLAIPGFQLESWRPVIPAYKGDGTYQSSPLSVGRQIVNRQFDNPIEQFGYKSQDFTQDELITRTQDLVRLLEKAVAYWVTDWQNEPVWIEASAKCETNIRYGHIMSYRIPELENPFNQPFLQPDNSAVMDSMTLILEHTIWTENQPGTGTAVELSAVETYDGRSLGNVDSAGSRDPTTANEVYIGNKRNEANLTHIFIDDGGVFGANLMDAALPYNLLPAVPAVNDAVYFGIDTTGVDDGPFCSLVFDIGTIGDDYSGTWEYWDGAAWSTITTITDLTEDTVIPITPFELSGVNAVSWNQPSDWATTAVNAVTAYWVRMRVSGLSAAPVGATQQNRDVYSAIWPYVEIQNTQIPGDIPCLAEVEVYGQSDIGIQYNRHANRIVWGLRSYDRGDGFTAFINFSGDRQNPSGVNGNAVAPGAFAADVRSSANRVVAWNPVGSASDVNIALVTIDRTIVQDFYGKYHAFLRAIDDTGTATISFYATTGQKNGVATRINEFSSELDVAQEWGFIDLGILSIPTSDALKVGDPVFEFEIRIYGNTDGAAAVKLNDLVLIPVDEYAMDCLLDIAPFSVLAPNIVHTESKLNMDSITAVKYHNLITIGELNNSTQSVSWFSVSPGKVILQSNSRQRLWFVTAARQNSPDSGAINISTPYNLNSVLVYRNSQYTTMRGNR